VAEKPPDEHVFQVGQSVIIGMRVQHDHEMSQGIPANFFETIIEVAAVEDVPPEKKEAAGHSQWVTLIVGRRRAHMRFSGCLLRPAAQ